MKRRVRVGESGRFAQFIVALAVGACGLDQREPLALGGEPDAGDGTSAPGRALALEKQNLDFGLIRRGAVATLTLELRNVSLASLMLEVALSGVQGDAFAMTEDCASVLSVGERCVISVSFTSEELGSYMAQLDLGVDGQPEIRVPLSAVVVNPDGLSTNTSQQDFGLIGMGDAPATFEWKVYNGNRATGELELSGVAPPFAIERNDCTGSLAPNGSCSITFSFAPTSPENYARDVQLSDGTQSASLALTGEGGYPFTVTLVGSGRITVQDAEVPCEFGVCKGVFRSSQVIFRAAPRNGSGYYFARWDFEECGARQLCPLDVTEAPPVTATFLPLTQNIIFTSAETFRVDLGGLARYDAECNRLASAAGINDADENAYVAAMSDSSSSLRERLGTARGWVRPDGNLFGDSIESIFDNNGVIYSASLDEMGRQDLTDFRDPFSGTLQDGSSAPNNCNEWTSTSGEFFGALARGSGGPRTWVNFGVTGCNTPVLRPLVCMGRTRSVASTLVRTAGKLMWTVFGYTPGTGMTPDQRCQNERPPGVASAVAFVAYADRAAAGALAPDVTYVRPDGAVVGKGRDIARRSVLASPWLRADGTFNPILNAHVWVGAATPDVVAEPPENVASNCGDWTSNSDLLRGRVSDYGESSNRWVAAAAATATAASAGVGDPLCNTSQAVYCVEQ